MGVHLKTVFYLDPRGLALLRIALGVVVVLKLLHLWPSLGLVLGADGVLPSFLLSKHTAAPWGIASIYAWPASLVWLKALAVGHLLLAAAFAFGFRTRWTAILLWYFTISLNTRNPLIMNGGDYLLVVFLFFAIFLPVGQCLSLDASHSKRSLSGERQWVVDFFSACFVLQLVVIYTFSGFAKTDLIWMVDYQALECALKDETYRWGIASLLLQLPLGMKALTLATLIMEKWGLMLLFLPSFNRFFRTVIPLIFIGFHLGILLSLNIGLFPIVCIAAWGAMFPPGIYDRVWNGLRARGISRISARPLELASKHSSLPYLCACLAMLYLLAGTRYRGEDGSWQRLLMQPIRSLQLAQSWNLYAPAPPAVSRWFSIEGYTSDGQRMILYPDREQRFTPSQGGMEEASYATYFLRKYFDRVFKTADPVLFDAGIRGFRHYWLNEAESGYDEATWQWVRWTRRHYPERQQVAAREVVYTSRSQ